MRFKEYLEEVETSPSEAEIRNFSTALEAKYNVELLLQLYLRPVRLVINSLIIPKENRKEGIGTKIMEDVVKFADNKQLMIALTADNSLGGTSVSRLQKFYKRFGFVVNKGRKKNWKLSETMYRLPEE